MDITIVYEILITKLWSSKLYRGQGKSVLKEKKRKWGSILNNKSSDALFMWGTHSFTPINDNKELKTYGVFDW
jgi:hypothetical protein